MPVPSITKNPPFISVIIPVYNGGPAFIRCLQALFLTAYPSWECVIVDDGSTDDSVNIGRGFGAVIQSSATPRGGPGKARNQGAQVAKGDIVFFIDADVLVQPETVGLVAKTLEDESVAACFGSYDDSPTEANFLSQYRNLQHHYVHQSANEEAFTFWSGCGAVRRRIFLEMGGFNVTAYPRPSIEDIELGYRIRAAGYRIRLEKSLQVGHMKQWTANKVLVTDVRDRAIPWTQLILQDREIPNDLNLQASQRVSAAAVFIDLVGLVLVPFSTWGLAVALAATAVLLWLNRGFYGYLHHKRGIWFLLKSLPWHWFYFIYSGLTFAGCLLWYRLLRFENPAPKSNRIQPLPPLGRG